MRDLQQTGNSSLNSFGAFIDEICRVFNLGDHVLNFERASGGRIHNVWKLETTEGRFAVKVLNKVLLKKKDILAAFERSERVARAFSSHGIPAVSALQIEGKCLRHIQGKVVMVYQWVDGAVLSCGTVDKQCAEAIGQVLGEIHALDLDASEFRPAIKPIDPDCWRVLSAQAQELGHQLAELLETNLERLNNWSQRAVAVEEAMQETMLLTHADLDQQNVIWSGNLSPAIIDWESASLQNATGELLNLCLDWSGFPETIPCKEAFQACLRGYRKGNAGKTSLISFEIALNGEFGYLLRWLLFSVTRSFSAAADEKDIAISEAASALRSLTLLDECKDTLISWLYNH